MSSRTEVAGRDAGALMYGIALSNMERCLSLFQAHMPAPKLVPFGTSFVYRYEEKSAPQAILQKLARTVSTLYGAHQLFLAGLFQEQGALQRVLDELCEDITFLCLSHIDGKPSEMLKRYLEDFYLEEFDSSDFNAPAPKRAMVPRQKIRVYLASHETTDIGTSTAVHAFEKVSKAYSGFIHAASPHIMDMYDGQKFMVRGMLGTAREREYGDDLWNYFFRSITSFALAASALGNASQCEEIQKFLAAFLDVSGERHSMNRQ